MKILTEGILSYRGAIRRKCQCTGWIAIRSRKKEKKNIKYFLFRQLALYQSYASKVKLVSFEFEMPVSVASVGKTASWWTIKTQRSVPLFYADAPSEVKRSENSETERNGKRVAFPALLSGLRLKRAWGQKKPLGKRERECFCLGN